MQLILCVTQEKKALEVQYFTASQGKTGISQVKKPLYTLYMVTLRL